MTRLALLDEDRITRRDVRERRRNLRARDLRRAGRDDWEDR